MKRIVETLQGLVFGVIYGLLALIWYGMPLWLLVALVGVAKCGVGR